MFGALFLGGLIGLERQWRQRMTGLRTNGLVAVGSAMFIMMGLRGSRGYRHFEPRLTPNNKRRSGSRQLGAGGPPTCAARPPCRQSIKSGNGFFPTNSTTPRSRTGRSW